MTEVLKLLFALATLALGKPPGVDESDSHTTGSYQPIAYHIGKESPSKPTAFRSYKHRSTFTLDTNSPVLTLDYGAEVAGFPFVEISSLSAQGAQIELKYSEPYDGLALPYGDGPW